MARWVHEYATWMDLPGHRSRGDADDAMDDAAWADARAQEEDT